MSLATLRNRGLRTVPVKVNRVCFPPFHTLKPAVGCDVHDDGTPGLHLRAR